MKIYVGNLNFNTTKETLQSLFSQHGHVASVEIVIDRGKKRSRGFAFIEMPDQKEAEAAIAALNGQKVDDWVIKVGPVQKKEKGKAKKVAQKKGRTRA